MAKKKKNTNIIDSINNFANNTYTTVDSYTINTSSSTASISYGINGRTYTTMYIPNNDVEYWPTYYSSYYWSNPFEQKKKTVFLQEELDI